MTDGPVLYGREKETDVVRRLLHDAARTGRGTVVTVDGEPGIGRSGFLRAVVAEARSAGFAAGEGRADEIGRIAPGAPLLTALRAGTEPLLDDAAFAGFATLLDRPLWLLDRVVTALRTAAADTPVLLALDDVQWADPLTRFALRMMPERLTTSPVVWLLAGRPGPRSAAAVVAAAGITATHVALEPLSEADTLALVGDLLGHEPDELTTGIALGLGGNPGLLVEMADTIRSGVPRPVAGRLPVELQQSVHQRIGALGPAGRDLLEIAAVWGAALPAQTAAALLGTSETSVLSAQQAAVTAGFLRADTAIAFRPDLTRAALYAGLNASRRRELHRACARFLAAEDPGDPVVAVPHVRAAATDDDLEAATALTAAAARYVGSMPGTAEELAVEAFGMLAPDNPARPGLAEDGIAVLCRARRFPRAIAIADQVLATATEDDTVARMQVMAARALWSTGNLAEIRTRIDAALGRPSLSPTSRARLRSARTLSLLQEERTDLTGAAVTDALSTAHLLGDAVAEQLALLTQAELASQTGRHEEALNGYRALRRLANTESVFDEVRTLQLLDRFDDAAALLAEIEQSTAPDQGAAGLLHARMWQHLELGSIDAAESDAHLLLTLCDEFGDARRHGQALAVLANVALRRGDLPLARQRLDRTPSVDGASNGRIHLALLRGWIRARDGDPTGGADVVRRAVGEVSATRSRWPWWPGWEGVVVKTALAAHDRRLAASAVEMAAEAAERNPGVATFAGVAQHSRGLVDGDPARTAQAVAILGTAPRPLLHGIALADHARLLLAAGDDASGTEALRRAREIYHGLGVHGPSLHLGFDAALTRGDRADTAHDDLTPMERRVAELVSAGHTNRSTARALGISSNTVSTHLRSAFAKLEVHSRVQLSNLLRDRGPDSRGAAGTESHGIGFRPEKRA